MNRYKDVRGYIRNGVKGTIHIAVMFGCIMLSLRFAKVKAVERDHTNRRLPHKTILHPFVQTRLKWCWWCTASSASSSFINYVCAWSRVCRLEGKWVKGLLLYLSQHCFPQLNILFQLLLLDHFQACVGC